MKVKTRTINERDYAFLMRAHEETCKIEGDVFTVKKYAPRVENVTKNGWGIVIEVNEPVGLIEYNPKPPSLPGIENYYWLGLTFIVEEHRRKGYSKILYNALFEELKKKGVKGVAFDIFTTNKESIEIHEKMDFTEKMKIYVKEF